MNSIVERLRGFKSAAAQVWAHEAADLIEQQAERIKELEAERVVSGAMCVIEGRCLSGEQHQRIKELEAEVDANLQERVRMQHTINQYESGDKVSRHYACPDCAALRQRIDDAPVVAWMRGEGMGSPVATEDYLKAWPGIRSEFPIPLISKEDLL